MTNTTSVRIPFNRVSLSGRELEYMQQAVEKGHISGDGPFTKKCHQFFEERLGVEKALLTTSCTHALEMSAILCDIQAGDEVIVPSFTFVSTVNAFVLRGAKAIFADIRPDTLNIDESRVEALITDRTKAIVAVHYAGVACEMDALLDICQRYGLELIEDNAHGLLGKYKGRYLGTFGAFATQSFHETKNVNCGEGGVLLINDKQYADRAEIIREKGTNRSRFFRGQVDKYSWVDIGSSYLPSDLLAAFLYAQLENIDTIQQQRKAIWQTYHDGLKNWAAAQGVRLPIVPDHCEQTWHMFYLLPPDLESRQRFIQHLRDQQISAVFHYLPLHHSDMGRALGGMKADCPVTVEMSDRLVRLPFYNSLSPSDQARVIDAVKSFVC
ncbi:MAG: dTDP-4-amino-4,6-dideoxygalactose transaminase [Candidatus Hydrogenedentales bacterium]|jgi:dTDP-4-amino-4,6-dideoxygalactose transaminase